MLFDKKAIQVAKCSVKRIRKQTHVIDEGESAAILAWWTFICDHASAMNKEPKQLAREQLEYFLDYVDGNLTYHNEH